MFYWLLCFTDGCGICSLDSLIINIIFFGGGGGGGDRDGGQQLKEVRLKTSK